MVSRTRTIAIGFAVMASSLESPPVAAGAASGQRGRVVVDGDREAAEQAERRLTISNWPLYIDKKTVSGLREGHRRFRSNTFEDVNDNAEFFGKLQPQLAAGTVRGAAPIFVVTDWMAKKMHDLGYVQKRRQVGLAQCREDTSPLAPAPDVRSQPRLSRAWQSG